MKDIYEILDSLNIPFEKHEHKAVFTCEEAEHLYDVIKGVHVKNLFLRNKKGDRHYLVVVPTTKKVDLKALKSDLGESKIGFASPERLRENLDVEPGSVSPLAVVNNAAKDVVVILDEDLSDCEVVNCHPNVNTATLTLKREDLLKFLEWCGNEVRWIKV